MTKKDLYEEGRKQLKKEIKAFLKEEEAFFESCGGDAYFDDTNTGYANRLLCKSLNLL